MSPISTLSNQEEHDTEIMTYNSDQGEMQGITIVDSNGNKIKSEIKVPLSFYEANTVHEIQLLNQKEDANPHPLVHNTSTSFIQNIQKNIDESLVNETRIPIALPPKKAKLNLIQSRQKTRKFKKNTLSPQINRFLTKSSIFICVFFGIWIWGSISRIQELANPANPIFVLQLFHAVNILMISILIFSFLHHY